MAWKLQQSPHADKVFAAPGNPGMQGVERVDASEPDDLADFACANGVGLTVVGPEAPLCAGIVDLFRARGLRIFGPDREAARLEGSKSVAKAFMEKHGIPAASSRVFTDRKTALASRPTAWLPGKESWSRRRSRKRQTQLTPASRGPLVKRETRC